MTLKEKARGGKRKALKLKKETIKDLDAKGKAAAVRGGRDLTDPELQLCAKTHDRACTVTCLTQVTCFNCASGPKCQQRIG